jgi:AraC-like DNA-binding protein
MPKEPPQRAYNPELPEGPDNPRPKGGEVAVSQYEAWQQRERQRRLGGGEGYQEPYTTKKGAGGRPPTVIDWTVMDELCGLGCTLDEIAGVFGCDPSTVKRAIKNTWALTFTQYWNWKSSGLKVSLRRAQVRLALGGNVLMQMFLGKQLLGQRDTLGAAQDADDDDDKNKAVKEVYGTTFVGAPGDENTWVAPPDAVKPYNASQPDLTPAESSEAPE